jgi:hypothetical protein
MLDWIRQLFNTPRSLRDDQISTNPAVYAPGGIDDDASQGDSGAADSGGSGSGGGSDSGGGGGDGGGS